jgi:hypothetical protein
MQNTITLEEIINQVRDREIDIAHLKGDLVAGKKAMDAAKLPAYAEVLAFLGSNTGGTLEGLRTFWTKRTAGAFREGLTASGVTPASAKRYSENAVGAFRVNDDLRRASAEGRAHVMAWFEVTKITSERAIKQMISKPTDPIETLADRIAKLSQDQYGQLVVRVATLQGVAKREAAAKRAREQGDVEVIASE